MKDDGRYVILGMDGDMTGVARRALKLLDGGQPARAAIWLDRVREEESAGSGDDPVSGSMFARLWQQGASHDDAAIRIAAAALLTASKAHIETTISILEKAKAAGTALDPVSASLLEAYLTAKQYDKAFAEGEELLKRLPQSPTAFRLALQTAYAKGGNAEAAKALDAGLPRFKQNAAVRRAAASVALTFGDTAQSGAILHQIIDSGKAAEGDYNNLAWSDLIAGQADQATLDLANKGMMLESKSTAMMHTMAALDAELGKLSEARAMILQRMKAEDAEEPSGDEWYVFARIAEQYGLKDEAASMYKKVERPKSDEGIASSSYALAQKRLAALGK